MQENICLSNDGHTSEHKLVSQTSPLIMLTSQSTTPARSQSWLHTNITNHLCEQVPAISSFHGLSTAQATVPLISSMRVISSLTTNKHDSKQGLSQTSFTASSKTAAAELDELFK
jgi:hypothetical protein